MENADFEAWVHGPDFYITYVIIMVDIFNGLLLRLIVFKKMNSIDVNNA